MKALVTGGGGFLGRYIVEQLRQRGDDVRVFSRGRYPELDELGIEQVQGDIRDARAVAAATQDVDAVFHTAAVTTLFGPLAPIAEINTQGTRHVIDACLAHRVPRLIYTSSPSVVFDGSDHLDADETLPYPEHFLSPYPQSKAQAEALVLEANGRNGLATTALRPHLIWGPRDNHLIPRLIARARSGRLRRVGDGSNLVSMVYVENAAAAHLQAADRLSPDSPVAGQAYFINEAEPVNLWNWIDELLQRAGLPPVQRSISLKAAYRLGAGLEGLYRLFRLRGEPPMTRFLALQLGRSHTYDIGKARRDFGYEPLVSVEEGLRRLEPELKRHATR